MKTIKSIIQKPQFTYHFSEPLTDILFFDIETTGLSAKASSIYLIGAMYFDEEQDCFSLVQWFADDYKSEEKIIMSFLNFLGDYNYLYHFNGRTFDIPYVLNKCDKYDITLSEHCEQILSDTNAEYSIDILAKIRPLKKKLSIGKANQTALEQWLGIMREDKYDGGKLISVYSEYMQKKIMKDKKAEELEALLLLHNHDDIGGMTEVCSILSYEIFANSDTKFVINDITLDDENMLTISFSYPHELPKRVTLVKELAKDKENILSDMNSFLTLNKKSGVFKTPVMHGILKHFYKNYTDYFYLKENDCVIHKSLIDKVTKKACRKATASTCYEKTEGFFIPSVTLRNMNESTTQFYLTYHDKISFFKLPEKELDITDTFWADYLKLQLSAIFA